MPPIMLAKALDPCPRAP